MGNKDEFYGAMVWGEGKRQRMEDKAKRRNGTGSDQCAAQRREMHIHRAKMGHHRSYSKAIEWKVMKINTLIITILKIKIEDSTLIVLIFKCLQYIDQHNPVFRWALRVSLRNNPRGKNMFCRKSFWRFELVKPRKPFCLSTHAENPQRCYIRWSFTVRSIIQSTDTPKHINLASYMWPLLTPQHFLCILIFFKG